MLKSVFCPPFDPSEVGVNSNNRLSSLPFSEDSGACKLLMTYNTEVITANLRTRKNTAHCAVKYFIQTKYR